MCFFTFWPFSKTALRILLILCKRVEDTRACCLSQLSFLKLVLIFCLLFEPVVFSEISLNFLIIGDEVPKKGFLFYFFGLFSKTAIRILLILCNRVEDTRAHGLSQIVFLKEFIMPYYRRLSVKNGCFISHFFALFIKTALRIFLTIA